MLTALALIMTQLATIAVLTQSANRWVQVGAMILFLLAISLLFKSLNIEAGLLLMLFWLGLIPLLNIIALSLWDYVRS